MKMQMQMIQGMHVPDRKEIIADLEELRTAVFLMVNPHVEKGQAAFNATGRTALVTQKDLKTLREAIALLKDDE